MYTIIGLGNPGAAYAHTRHNAGRIAATMLAEEGGIDIKEKKKPPHHVGVGDAYGARVRIALPDTFMNKSGAVALLYAKTPRSAKNLIVLYDDIDLPLGIVRVSFGRGSGGHRGIESIARAIKSKDFIRVRIGVSKASRGKAKKPSGEKAVVDFLLGTFTKGEYEALQRDIQGKALLAIQYILEDGDHIRAMNIVNGLK